MPKDWILGDKFLAVAPHTNNLKALWETKWRFPATKAVYPFHDGALEDFEPIFAHLISSGINDAYTDEYTEAFLPTARNLTDAALSKQAGGDRAAAVKLFLRAATVYRISRFPSMDAGSGLKRTAYNEQKQVYLRGAALFDVPLTEEIIPHTHAAAQDGPEIPLFVRFPKGNGPHPTVLLITGLDGHRPDNTGRSDAFLERGWASVIVDIPGVADCPADRKDPQSPDRLVSAILGWIAQNPKLDEKKVLVWGLSAGGYYAIRAAHTHAKLLKGCVAQGAGTHYFLGRDWLEHVDHHEYPFRLTDAYVKKYGYKDREELLENVQKDFSLVDSGILEMEHTRLLLVNGTHDGLMPIEDSMLCFEHGRAKEARFYDGLLHMGYPPANESVYPWMEQVMAT